MDILKKTMVKYNWLVLLSIGFSGFLLIWFFLPHKSEIDHIWQMLFKIFISFIIIAGISFFPNKNKLSYLLLLVPILGFVSYIIPRLSYLCYHGVAQNLPNGSQDYYTHLYFLTYPAIILTLCFAYRLGGGSPENCFKLGCGGVLILFSGLLDVMIYLITPLDIPDTLIYAHHIAIVIGKYPSFTETILFTLAHVPFIILLFVIPIKKVLKKIMKATVVN